MEAERAEAGGGRGMGEGAGSGKGWEGVGMGVRKREYLSIALPLNLEVKVHTGDTFPLSPSLSFPGIPFPSLIKRYSTDVGHNRHPTHQQPFCAMSHDPNIRNLRPSQEIGTKPTPPPPPSPPFRCILIMKDRKRKGGVKDEGRIEVQGVFVIITEERVERVRGVDLITLLTKKNNKHLLSLSYKKALPPS